MCGFFKVSSSGYYGWLRKTKQPDRDVELAALIGECHSKTKKTYGYRRVKIWLNREKGITVNHKTILRVMNKTNQLSQIRQRRRWIQYHNQKFTRYPNLLNRNFQADKPNQKWATDITYIMTKKDGVLFLSAIKDLYDGSIVAYKMSRTQSQKLVLDTIQAALKKEKVADGLTLHSDQGFQYTSAAYLNLTKRYGITASMSRAGNPLDNASMECFFGVLKTECLYFSKPATHEEARLLVRDFICFYNQYRICQKTGLTPYEKRSQSA
jgi:transposase InsO family protein